MELRRCKQERPRGRFVLVALGAAAAFTLMLGVGRADAVTIADQDSSVENSGVAVANTGANAAAGNASDNTADNDQVANAGDAGDDSVAVNSSSGSNSSSGTAAVHTGDADAVGNQSATSQSQVLHTGGQATLVLVDQESDVDNAGVGVANTGFNAAIGNASDNTVDNDQLAVAGDAGDDSVAVNFADTGNHSDGSALVSTGDAWAAGNVADTYVSQLVTTEDAVAITLVDQVSDVDNEGVGVANTGFNFALGNISDNAVDNDQVAWAGGGLDDVVAVNFATVGNASTGTAFIRTGNASAIGNLSGTTVCQGVNATPMCPRAVAPSLPGGSKPGVPTAPTHTPGGTSTPHLHSDRSRVVASTATEAFGIGGGTLARTGSSLATLAAAGALLVSLGAFARRRTATS